MSTFVYKVYIAFSLFPDVILITSQIVNFKMIGDVFILIKCYQCGGETLGPVVKHSVRATLVMVVVVVIVVVMGRRDGRVRR
jgi:hypothetical protein